VKLLATLAASAALGLPGIQGGPAPWVPEWDHLAARLQADGLPVLSAESFVVHIHQHLDLYVRGKHEPLPALIGINVQQRYLSPIHTHDFSGIVHVESPTRRTFTLGQFWDVYGVKFDAHCVGGECGGVRVFVNGTRYRGNPRGLVLRSHQEIVVAVGAPPRRVPRRYAFPAGL
jgi:hypothetical protein